MNFSRIKKDLKYIYVNYFVMKIPSWTIRKRLLIFLGMKIGNSSRIGIGSIIISPDRIVIGERTVINEKCHLDGRGGLIMGNDVSISNYSIIITASHKKGSSKFEYYENNVVIENNVWLGTRAMVLDGSYLRKGTVIAAGLVFKGETEAYKVYYPSYSVQCKDRNLDRDYILNYTAYFR